MGRINPWFEALLGQRFTAGAPAGFQSLSQFLPSIVQVEEIRAVPDVVRKIKELLPGVQLESALSFIRVPVPVPLLERLATIDGVRVVSYDAPVYIRGTPSILDPLLGRVAASNVTLPVDIREALSTVIPRSPLTALGLLGSVLGTLTRGKGPASGIHAPGVSIVTTDETRRWVSAPEKNGISTKVGVIDTGITVPHPLLHPSQGLPVMLTATGEVPFDGLGHGQWCNTAAFGDSFWTRFGLCRGVADPGGSNLISVKALSNLGFGTQWSVLQAMRMVWEQGAKVVNMSLGGPLQASVNDDPQCQMVELLKDDVIFVCAAGNSGPSRFTIGSPGASPFAVTVGSWSTLYDALSVFSSQGANGDWYTPIDRGAQDAARAIQEFERDLARFGRAFIKPDVVAPGGGPGLDPDRSQPPSGRFTQMPVAVAEGEEQDQIYSGVTGWMDGVNDWTPGDGFDAMRGTSMASPHAAGIIAIAYDRGWVRTAADVKAAMARSSRDPHTQKYLRRLTGSVHLGKDEIGATGYGLITLERLALR